MLISRMKSLKISEGQYIFRAGEIADRIVIVTKGTLAATFDIKDIFYANIIA
jgi:CRP-like cAMP-binding protein